MLILFQFIVASANIQITQKSPQQLDLERAEFLMHQALDEDEDGAMDEAVQLYSEAVDVCLKAVRSIDPTFWRLRK